ncbi:MAG: O-antigen ligase family protein [Myxococcales bacterium]
MAQGAGVRAAHHETIGLNMRQLRESWPVVAILAGSLVFQRFGLPLGQATVPAVLPIVVIVFVIAGLQGRVTFSRRGLSGYVLLFLGALLSTAFAVAVPADQTTVSYSSLLYLVLIYAVLAFRLSPALGVVRTVTVFRNFVVLLALAGCLQFGAQLVGWQLFSFANIVPERFLIEKDYNVVIPLWRGAHIFKSNGFFLLEPSMLSQIVAVGLAIEFLYFGKLWRMALLALAFLAAFSGTGILVFGFAVVAALVLDRKSSARCAKLLVIAGAVTVLFAAVAPQYIEVFTTRASDMHSEQTSAHMRFISPYKIVADLADDPRSLLGFGPGTAERFRSTSYVYGVNAFTKIWIEYGPLGLLFFLLLLASTLYRADMKVLSAVGLFWFAFGGGYLLMPAVVYTLAALLAWGPGLSPSRLLEYG